MFEKNNIKDKENKNKIELDRFKYEVEEPTSEFPIIYDGKQSKENKDRPKIKIKK